VAAADSKTHAAEDAGNGDFDAEIPEWRWRVTG
jgi:hypothetical protein